MSAHWTLEQRRAWNAAHIDQRRAESRTRYVPRPLTHEICQQCGDTFEGRKGTKYCSYECVHARSLDLQAAWRAAHPEYMSEYGKVYNRTDKGRAHSTKKRVQRAAAFDEDVDFSLVYQAFQGICQGCFGFVGRNIPWPDPMSESLDHIRPISNGGRHNYGNVQLMHLRCNMRKSASI